MQNFKFRWHGINRSGKHCYGKLEAANSQAVLLILKQQHITPLSINPQKLSLIRNTRRIKAIEIIEFTQQLVDLLNTGINMVQSLIILEQNLMNPVLQNIIKTIRQQVEAGHHFSQALQVHPRYFSNLYCQLVMVGEQTGQLTLILEKIIQYELKMLNLVKKIKKALFYPATVVGVATLVTAVLLIFVVPQFAKIFQDFGAPLPIYTRFILSCAAQVPYFLIILTILGFSLFLIFSYSKKNKNLRAKLDHIFLILPLLGQLLRQNIIVRFTETTAIALAAKIPLPEALQIIANTCHNITYTNAICQMRDDILTGTSIYEAMQKNNHLFPTRLLQIIAVAEESGTLQSALEKIALFYQQQIDNGVTKFIQLLEPLIMIILGLIIGGLITAIYLPIFKLGNVI